MNLQRLRKIFVYIIGLFLWTMTSAWGQTTSDSQEMFSHPFRGRLFTPNEAVFSGALSVGTSMKESWSSVPNSHSGAAQKKEQNQKATLTLQYSPLSFFFANITVRQPLKNQTNRYQNDFFYTFGYDDWHPNTWSLVYSNYNSNYIWTPADSRRSYFERGAVTLAYKFTLPDAIEKHLLLQQGDSLVCQTGYSWGPRYYDLQQNEIQDNKNVISAGCGYTFRQHFFVRFTAFWYPDGQQQQPWNGDYSYSFGYATYLPGSLSIQYANYTGTRYPWAGGRGNAKFLQGTVSLVWFIPF